MIAFVFPGQGSQAPGMGRAFVDDVAWEVVTAASDAVGRDVSHLLLDADADELVETRNAQLGTFVFSMVVHDALSRAGLIPAAVGGHSLGEFSALVAGGVLSHADGTKLVAERGEAMQACTTERIGTMAAVLGLDDEAVAAVCERIDGDVWVANRNAPGQVVIAGDPGAIDAAGTSLKEAGAKRTMALPVSGAFHTPFMAPAAARLGAAIDAAAFEDASVPVVANVDGAIHTAAADWPDLLRRQLTSPVLWTTSVETLAGLGVTDIVEVGPGAVLTGTAKRIDKTLGRHTVSSPADVASVVQTVSTS